MLEQSDQTMGISKLAEDSTYCIFGDLHLIPNQCDHPRLNSFFDEVNEKLSTGKKIHLVFNGDTFDFAMNAHDGFCAQGSHAVEALQQLDQQFPEFFQGIANVLKAQGKVAFIAGNHDLELSLPAVQKELTSIVKSHGDQTFDIKNLVYSSWFYQPEPSLYIEHGHQYDAENSVYHPLAVGTEEGCKQAYPVGTVLTWYFAAHFQDLELILNANRHFWDQAKHILLRYKARAPYAYWLFLKGAYSCIAQMVKASFQPTPELESFEKDFSEAMGIDPEWPAKIRALMKKPTHMSAGSILRRLFDLLLTTKDLRGDMLINDLKDAATRVREVTGAHLVVFSHLHTCCEEEGYANTGSFSYPRSKNRASFLQVQMVAGLPQVARRFMEDFPIPQTYTAPTEPLDALECPSTSLLPTPDTPQLVLADS